MRYAHSISRWSLYRFRIGLALLLLASLLLEARPHCAFAGGVRSNTAVLSALSQQFSAIQSLGSAGGTWLLHNEGLRLDVSRTDSAQLEQVFQRWQKQPSDQRATLSSSLKQLSKTIRSRAHWIETRNDAKFYEINQEFMTAQFMFRDHCIQSAIIAVRQNGNEWTVFTASPSVIRGPQKPLVWQAFSGNTVASRLNPSGQIVAKIVTTQLDAQTIANAYLGQGWHEEMPEDESFRPILPVVFRRGTSVVTVAASSTPRAETLVLLIQGN